MNTPSPRFDITRGEPIPEALAEADRLLTDTLQDLGLVIIKRSTLDALLADNDRLKAHKISLMRRLAKARKSDA